MYFIVIGKDGTDAEAQSRRSAARPAHIDMVNAAHAKGEQLMGVAMLNDTGEMTGSMMVVNFENRAKLDEWLSREPYVLQNVWQDIEIIPCQVPPVFLKP